MTITNIGYQGDITTDDQWGRVAGRPTQYGVGSPDDFAVTPVAVGDRTVRVAPGEAWGKGILDVNDTSITVQPTPITSSSRWDTIALRRNRDTKTTSVVVVAGTTAKALAAGLRRFSATSRIDDQPLALVQVNAFGSTAGVIGLVEDLRCWGENAGLIAKSTLVMGYLDRPGTKVRIRGFEWSYEFDTNDTLRWTRTGVGRLLDVHPGAFFTLPPSGRFGAGVQVWGNPTQSIASVTIPDPGVPYRISCVATGFWGSETDGTRWDLDFMAGSSLLSLWINLGTYSSTYRRWSIDRSGEIFTGEQTVYLRARRVFGTGYGAVSIDQRNIAARSWQA